MASIKKIEGKNGVSYKITVSCGYDVKGKKIIETATFKPDAGLTPKKMEKAAQDFAHEFESRVKSGAAMDGRKVTLQVFADRWIEEYAKPKLQPGTVRKYREELDDKILPAIGHYKLSEIKPHTLNAFFLSLTKDGARKDGKVGGRIGAYVAIGVTVAAVVVMGGRMIAYTAHAKAEHKAAIEASCQSITWPDGDFAKKLPSLANQKGEVYSDSSDYVSIKLCNATQSSFDSYVKDAKKMGFIVDYDKSAHSFTAKDADDNEITVFFMEDEEDGNTMDITLDAPKSEDDSKVQDSTDSQQTQESQNQQQSQNAQQQEQQSQQNQQSQQSDPSQVSADFKASMDSYEQFFDQYVEFMKKYKDSGDSISMLADYTKMMQQYTDTMNKLNAIDQNSLSAADEAYYLEVMGRITQKLASVA